MKCDMIYVTKRDALFWDILTWIHYLIAPLYRILIMICCELIYDILIDPIYLGIYDGIQKDDRYGKY